MIIGIIVSWIARADADLVVAPITVTLESPEASQQLLVTTFAAADGRHMDLTTKVTYELRDPSIATVDDRGLVRPRAEGRSEILIRHNDQHVAVPLEVTGFRGPAPVSFRQEVIPILSKAGCNSSECHGKAEGKNGFKLSIFGFDAGADFSALVKEGCGRRVSLAAPGRSLMLAKATGRVPHGGGLRFEVDSYLYRRLHRWISEGARWEAGSDKTGEIISIEVEPREQRLLSGEFQQLRVIARDRAGKPHCVSNLAQYESNSENIAHVDDRGLVQAQEIPGEAVILVRYLEQVSYCQITLPREDTLFERPPEANFIDGLVWDKLQRLGIAPSELADDATFLRRVFLDTIGTLPTGDEARSFLADRSSDKRSRLIDHVLERNEYADYWTMRWLDILRADQLKITPQGAVAMQRWLHRGFKENRSFDELARELLTVQGNTSAEGPGSFYKILNKPDEVAKSLSQLLLGVRIECAKCHHHPSERWTQEDYVALAGFFTGVSLKTLPPRNPVAASEMAVVVRAGEDLPHPRSQEPVPTRALGASVADFSQVTDRRVVLANWMTAPENPYFAKAIANRLWAHYFGRGLIEPIDDIRDTNPASNEPLMEALADHMREIEYDLKQFTRSLLNSRSYQLSHVTNQSNHNDVQGFSHASTKALPAEVLLDAICQSAGVMEEFNGWPPGYRAIQVWDNRMPSYFFRIFGKPLRVSVCECERSNEPSVAQALHLLNSPEIAEKIGARHGRARKLAQSDLSNDEIIEQLYLVTLARLPGVEEHRLMQQAFIDVGEDRAAAVEDVLWTLVNSKQFVYNH